VKVQFFPQDIKADRTQIWVAQEHINQWMQKNSTIQIQTILQNTTMTTTGETIYLVISIWYED
jgi:hypothetical protein